MASPTHLCGVKYCLSLLLFGQLWFGASTALCQIAHTIRGLDFYYQPDTLWMQPGDSVRFQTPGIHNMVETDSMYWGIGQAVGNGGFETVINEDTTFVIDTAGTYYFVCAPHGWIGMRGVLIVEPPLATSVQGTDDMAELELYPVPSGNELFVKVSGKADIEVKDGQGRVVGLSRSLDPGITRIDISRIPPGVYFITVHYADMHRAPRSVRFIVSP